jgi:cytochrome c-type biogenesis protein CcmH/NrfG
MFWLLVPLLLASPAPPRNAHQDLASTLASGDLVKSQSALEQATRREPNNARAWMLLAQIYAREKKSG